MANRKKSNTRSLPKLLNLWVVASAFVFAWVLLFIILASLWLTRSTASPKIPATAIFSVLSASLATQSQMPPSVPTNASQLPPPPLPGEIILKAYVQVVGTSGEGLHLREAPGLGNRVLLLGSESEIFRIDDGPREIDGYTWWYLVGPFDANRRGWAVSNYLKVVQNP